MKIVADEKIPFLQGVLEPFAEVKYRPGSKISNSDLADADALITRTRTRCTRELLENTQVKFIASATIGFDHIDTDFCRKAGIEWQNAPGCNSGSVAQYVATSLLYLAKKHNFDLKKKKLGIVGVGNVGKKVEKIARTLGMRVMLNDPPRQREEGSKGFVPLEKIIWNADIITFHVPLNHTGQDKTLHLANEGFFELLKENAILINTSRGEVIETQALKQTLRWRRIKAAVLDVWEREPLIDPELMVLCDLATPHIAGYSKDGKANGTAMSVQALSRFFGLPLNHWTPDNIPVPENTHIKIDAEDLYDQEVFEKAVSFTYDIVRDSHLLKKMPDLFEKYREEYPLRREFSTFTVDLQNASQDIAEKLNQLNFKLKTTK